jgi:putative PIN family toxin of toxin-antitoxin system
LYRAVIDPGVLISALLSPKGAPAAIVRALAERQYRLIVSPNLLHELQQVLLRRKFRKYCSVTEALNFVADLRSISDLVFDPVREGPLTPDPGDDYLIALVRVADADFLVSGDRGLLSMRESEPRLLTPREFVQKLQA